MANTITVTASVSGGFLITYVNAAKNENKLIYCSFSSGGAFTTNATGADPIVGLYSHGLKVVEVDKDFCDAIGPSVWDDLAQSIGTIL